jgi:DnaJ-class molecular chaperone
VTAPALAALVDCEVCGGTGVMTARAVNGDPAAPPAVIPCPACAGAGATIVRPTAFPRPASVTR